MAQITWNNVAAPNLSDSNILFAQAIQSLKDAGAGLKDTAKDYQTVVRNRSHAILQDYINSAKTPEELQSEAFNTGFKNLQATLANEFDAVKVNDYRNNAVDKLLSRKANQVSIDTNQFSLDTGRKNQLTKEFTNKILAAPPEQRDALKQAAVDANAFDASAYQQYVQGEGTIRNQNNEDKLFNATYAANVKNANLAPVATEHGMKIADGQLAVSQQNATANMLQAKAAAARAEEEKNKNKNAYIGTGLAAIDNARKAVKEKIYGSGLNTDGSKTLGEWVRVKKEEGNDPLPEYIAEVISTHPQLKGEPENIQTLYATKVFNAFSDRRALYNPVGWMTDANKEKVQSLLTTAVGEFKQQVKTAEDNATIPIYRKTVLEHAQKTGASGYAAAKDLGLDELTIYKADIPSQLAAQAKLKYASSDKSIPENQFIENEIRIATDPNYGTSDAPLFPKPKQEAANVPAQSSRTVLNTLGTGSYEDKVAMLGSELKKTKDPIQIAFLNNELKKLEKDAPPVTANTSNSLQEQQQRMEAAALARLTAAALKQNGRPPVTPTITAKPEEFKPRELTPAEKQQAERMNQEALFRLTGAKLGEKQAEVQKQFPTTPLKELAKAVTPVPSPLIPVESQNAYKVKENNLSINLSTGKSVPSKDPVPMPNVAWKEPVQVVAINPIFAQLPQYKAVVTYAGDGDTVLAKSNKYTTKGRENESSNVECRIDSVDAPETPHPEHGKKGQPYGEEAAKILQQMVLNKEVSIRVTKPTDGESNYGRDVCQIEVSGKDVSVELLRAGAAWLYQYKDKRTGEDYNRYGSAGIQLEQQARDAKRGLWKLPNPKNPYIFRQEEKRKQRGQ